MRARKEIVLDLIYGILLSLILLAKPEINNPDNFLIEVFKSICTLGIIFIWFSTISKGFTISPFIKIDNKKKFDLNQYFQSIQDLTSAKVAIVVCVFSLKFIYDNEYFFEQIIFRSLQVTVSVIYFMVLFLALKNTNSIQKIKLWLTGIIFVPYLIIIFLHEVLHVGVISSLFLPTNLMILTLDDTFSIGHLCIYLVGLAATIYVFFALLRSEFRLLKNIS